MLRWTALVMMVGCAPAPSSTDEAVFDTGAAGATRCLPDGDGAPVVPTSVADVLALAERLPQPVTGPCLIEAFARPLPVRATTSTFSAQPAGGPDDPRLFLLFDGVILSFVTAGEGASLLEFAEPTTSLRSVKAEVELPIAGPIRAQAAFDRVNAHRHDGTGCAVCHVDERVHDPARPTFDSVSIRPDPRSLVDLTGLEARAAACDPVATPERCAMFSAILDHGPVVDTPFPEAWPTIFELGEARR